MSAFNQSLSYTLVSEDDSAGARIASVLRSGGLNLVAEGDDIITVVEHILTARPVKSGLIIDCFLNVCEAAELDLLKQQYAGFLACFNAVEYPVFLYQLMQGYQQFHTS